MLETHRALHERYRALRESRSGPVFFIEHGLSEEEIADVFTDVGRHLPVRPLEGMWWQAHCLPLLVAATEVGYRYRGTGTDFWPVLESEFGVEFSVTERWAIRDLFESASHTCRGVQPPTTPWAKAFHLIAWPITHALVPREFHRPLALTLANLHVHIGELSDDELNRAIRIAASSGSSRFANWLENTSLVVAVTRSLLGDATGELSPEIVERIRVDVAADQVARRAVVVARRRQRSLAQQPGSPKPPRAARPTVVGSFRLHRRDGTMKLEAVFPPLEADLQTRLQRALRRRRYAARLWGVSLPIPSMQLLSGLPFTVKLTTAPPQDAELLPNLDQIDIESKLRDALATLELDPSPLQLFAISPDGTIGRRVQGPKISGDRKYWLLSGLGEGPPGCPAVAEVGPYECHLLDPAEEIARKVLQGLRFEVRFGVSVRFAGKPPLERDAPAPVFAVADERIVVPRRVPRRGLSVQLADEAVNLEDDDVAIVKVGRGDHTLRISNGDEDRDYTFRGTSQIDPAPPATCWIAPRSSDLTVQALLRGALDFAIESFAPIKGLELTVEVEAGGRKLFAIAPLDPLPCLVSTEQEPFKTLLDDDTRALLAQAPSATLRLSAGRLCSHEMVLVQRVRPCWWQRTGSGSIALASEIGVLPHGWIPASTPANRPVSAPANPSEDARLLAPIDLDASEYGDAAQFTTLCLAPSQLHLEAPAIKKPRLTRRRRAENGALGFEDLLEGYLRWSVAESPTIIGEIRRQQVTEVLDNWFVEACCGERWARCEAVLGEVDPWRALVRTCDETGLGRDSYVELSREDEVTVTRIGVREIRSEYPDLWARVGPPNDLGPNDYDALNLACGRGYTELADAYRKQGRESVAAEVNEGDPGSTPEQWESVLGPIKSAAELLPLTELLLPSDSARGLMALEPSMMTLDELTEELTAWARDARGALAGSVPADDTLRAILALWVEPETAMRLDWRGALDVLLAERPVARAARYLALRSRLARRHDDTR